MTNFKRLKASELKNGDIVVQSFFGVEIEKTVVSVTFDRGMFIIEFLDKTRIYDNGLMGLTYKVKQSF